MFFHQRCPSLPNKISGPVVCIGDVHGETKKLKDIIRQLKRGDHLRNRWIVFLGDLVDRGPDTRGTLDYIIKLGQRYRVTAVMGNHDLTFAIAIGVIKCPWQRKTYGAKKHAKTTYASYDTEPCDLWRLSQAVPDEHKAFLSKLPWVVEHPDYVMMHGNLVHKRYTAELEIRDMPYEEQMDVLRSKDALNYPEPVWLYSFRSFFEIIDYPKTIVSGHYNVNEVTIMQRVGKKIARIMVDTGCSYPNGKLSAILLPEMKVFTAN